ncbi:MAG: hypothetical protein B6I35_14965, partial [Anaerolineaceae bacterium 4572_32.2]
HLDDAAWSCGGRIHQLAQAGEAVFSITIFAGSPSWPGENGPAAYSEYAAYLHQRWGTNTDAMAVRRVEDQTAMGVLGSDFWHLSHLDCIYRQHPVTGEFLYRSNKDIFAEVHPIDFLLAAKVQAELTELIASSKEATIYSPLGAGHHVDHQIVASAALGMSAAGYNVVFYQDYPYAEDPAALTAAKLQMGREKWQPEFFTLSAQDLQTKIEAALCYRSQLDIFFDSDDDVSHRLRAYALTSTSHPEPGECIWHLTK